MIQLIYGNSSKSLQLGTLHSAHSSQLFLRLVLHPRMCRKKHNTRTHRKRSGLSSTLHEGPNEIREPRPLKRGIELDAFVVEEIIHEGYALVAMSTPCFDVVAGSSPDAGRDGKAELCTRGGREPGFRDEF
jgi:hypothetical protein